MVASSTWSQGSPPRRPAAGPPALLPPVWRRGRATRVRSAAGSCSLRRQGGRIEDERQRRERGHGEATSQPAPAACPMAEAAGGSAPWTGSASGTSAPPASSRSISRPARPRATRPGLEDDQAPRGCSVASSSKCSMASRNTSAGSARPAATRSDSYRARTPPGRGRRRASSAWRRRRAGFNTGGAQFEHGVPYRLAESRAPCRGRRTWETRESASSSWSRARLTSPVISTSSPERRPARSRGTNARSSARARSVVAVHPAQPPVCRARARRTSLPQLISGPTRSFRSSGRSRVKPARAASRRFMTRVSTPAQPPLLPVRIEIHDLPRHLLFLHPLPVLDGEQVRMAGEEASPQVPGQDEEGAELLGEDVPLADREPRARRPSPPADHR